MPLFKRFNLPARLGLIQLRLSKLWLMLCAKNTSKSNETFV